MEYIDFEMHSEIGEKTLQMCSHGWHIYVRKIKHFSSVFRLCSVYGFGSYVWYLAGYVLRYNLTGETTGLEHMISDIT